MDEIIDTKKYKAHIYDVIGAIHEVHKELGPGLNVGNPWSHFIE